MPAFRVGARLDVKGEKVVKGRAMDGLQVVGDPHELALCYQVQGADELLVVDVVASLYQRSFNYDLLRRMTAGIFIPVTVCGGIRSVEDAAMALRCGADRIAVNTAAVERPALISELAKAFGSQAVIVSIEAKDRGDWYEAYTDGGREPSRLRVEDWACKALDLGAREILLTSVDKDGTRTGLDRRWVQGVRFKVPVILSGGAVSTENLGKLPGLVDGISVGASLHAGETIADFKAPLPYVRRTA